MIPPPVLAACPVAAGPGAIISSTLNAAGTQWLIGDVFSVSGGNGDAFGVVDTIDVTEITLAITFAAVGQTNPVIAVDQGLKTFTEANHLTDSLGPGVPFLIQGSTGNDGTYTVASFSVDGGTGHTTITTVEAIPDATADGSLATAGQVTVAGDHTTDFPPTATFVITGSIGNDGAWVTAISLFASGSTRIFVTTDTQIGESSASGNVNTSGGIATYHLTATGSGYSTASNVALIAVGSFGLNASLNIVAA